MDNIDAGNGVGFSHLAPANPYVPRASTYMPLHGLGEIQDVKLQTDSTMAGKRRYLKGEMIRCRPIRNYGQTKTSKLYFD